MKVAPLVVLMVSFYSMCWGQTNNKYKTTYYHTRGYESWIEASKEAAKTYKAPGTSGQVNINSIKYFNTANPAEQPKPFKAPGTDLFQTSSKKGFSGNQVNAQRFYNSECYEELGFSPYRNYEYQLHRYEECELKKRKRRILTVLTLLFILIPTGAYVAHKFFDFHNLLGKKIVEVLNLLNRKSMSFKRRTKKCQYCQSRINSKAIVCKFCQREVNNTLK